MKIENITLKEVTKSDIRFLYKLLRNRNPKTNISHQKMPSFSEHIKFVKLKPYSKWYIIFHHQKKIGSIYLSKQNEIGMFLSKGIISHKIKKTAMEQLMKKNPRNRFIANCSPNNKDCIRFFMKNSFKLVQYSYEFFPKNPDY